MNEIGNKIKKLMDKYDISFGELSERTDIPKSALHRYVTGETEKMPIDRVEVVARELHVEPSYLMGWSDLEEMIASPDSVVTIPVLGLCPCGTPIEAIENIVDYEEISASMARKGHHFGLLAVGDSMFPSIMENDVLIVRQSSVVESGSIAIVKVNGDDATCKKIMIDEDGITLIPLNSIYDPIRYNNDEIKKLPITICGQVVEVRRKF